MPDKLGTGVAAGPGGASRPPTLRSSSVTLRYRVFSADPVRGEAETTLPDGEKVTVVRDIVSVQLLPDGVGSAHNGTITLGVPQSQAEGHPFKVGATIEVTFSEVNS